MDHAAEHHIVDLGRHHHKARQVGARDHAEGVADHGEQGDLAEDVSVHLAPREAQDPQRGDLADALVDVDVGEVVEHDKGECRRRDDQHHDDEVHDTQHRAVGVDRLVRESHGGHAA